MRRTIVACVIVALVAGASTAAAAKLITGADIKNGSITGKDLAHPAIGHKAPEEGRRDQEEALAPRGSSCSRPREAPGPQGPAGPRG